MTPFRIVTVLLAVVLVAVVVLIIWAVTHKNERSEQCTALGGHWLDRYELCISDSATIRMP